MSIKRFYKKLKNALDWFWFIFKDDYNWDYSYLLKIIKFKLEKMEPEIRAGYALNADKTADEIKKTVELLELLIEDDFMKHWSALDDKYGHYTFANLPNGNTSLERPYVNKYNQNQYELDKEQAFEADAKEKKQVQDKFFRLLRKYENWWD